MRDTHNAKEPASKQINLSPNHKSYPYAHILSTKSSCTPTDLECIIRGGEVTTLFALNTEGFLEADDLGGGSEVQMV